MNPTPMELIATTDECVPLGILRAKEYILENAAPGTATALALFFSCGGPSARLHFIDTPRGERCCLMTLHGA